MIAVYPPDSKNVRREPGPRFGGAVTYAYDANGNQTQAGTRTFAYDLANRLKSTTSGSSTISYLYDGDNKRLQETAGSTVTKLLWDANYGLPEVALERNGSNALVRRYLHGVDLHSVQTSAGSFYYHLDRLGSVQNVTNASGATQWTYVYEPFGLKRTETKNNNKAPVNPLQFAGEYLDPAPSLYHLRARQYDPAVGRFQRTDPLTQPLSDPYVATYAYADNRPTVVVDPSGLDGESSDCGTAGVSTATAAYDAARGWGVRYTGVSHGMRSSDAAIRSRAGRALPSAGASRFARSPGFRAAGRVLPGVTGVAEFASARCQGSGVFQSTHRAVIATAVGAAGTAGAAAVCTIPAVATAGGATPLCAAGVATAGAGATYVGGKAADLAWSTGTRLGEELYELFG